MQYGCFKSVHFSKNLVVCSSAGPKILAFGSHCSGNFKPILDCFIPNFKFKYEDSENIKADRVSTVVSTYIKSSVERFFGTPGISTLLKINSRQFFYIFSQI